MTKKQLSLSSLLMAQKKFEQFRQCLGNEQLKTGAIKSFEYCFELSWTTLKKYLELYEAIEDLRGSRDTIRAAARLGILKNPEAWFDFIESRNLSSHVYEEDTADEIIEMLPLFSDELGHLINEINNRLRKTDDDKNGSKAL